MVRACRNNVCERGVKHIVCCSPSLPPSLVFRLCHRLCDSRTTTDTVLVKAAWSLQPTSVDELYIAANTGEEAPECLGELAPQWLGDFHL